MDRILYACLPMLANASCVDCRKCTQSSKDSAVGITSEIAVEDVNCALQQLVSPFPDPIGFLSNTVGQQLYAVEAVTASLYGTIFNACVRFGGQLFFGIGYGLHRARCAVIAAVLHRILQRSTRIAYVPTMPAQPKGQSFSDAIGQLINDKYRELQATSTVNLRRKVLAGFVLSQRYDLRSAKVVSLATGTKCLDGAHMSLSGSAINDCHAEIVARRGLVHFLYSQLEALQKATTEDERRQSIFRRPKRGGTARFVLKDGVCFHLYISTAPCGDARVFSPHDTSVGGKPSPCHKPNHAQGLLRAKLESSEGSIPIRNGAAEGVQTWDAILMGQRLRTMSCSDKILRWNILGLQGTLLAALMQPIYLDSIVLGSRLNSPHMLRAIHERALGMSEKLAHPYRLAKPELSQLTKVEKRDIRISPLSSVNWTVDSGTIEVIDASTGRRPAPDATPSRLSKRSFFERYAGVMGLLPSSPIRQLKPTYYETKMCVDCYQQRKGQLYATLEAANLGKWLKRPLEQEQFTIAASGASTAGT